MLRHAFRLPRAMLAHPPMDRSLLPLPFKGLSARMTSTMPSFLTGENSVYMEEMFREWKRDPSSVHKSWDIYFRHAEDGKQVFVDPLSLQPGASPVGSLSAGTLDETMVQKELAVYNMIRAYQFRGHTVADLDPLGLLPRDQVYELQPKTYGLTEEDMEKEFNVVTPGGVTGYFSRTGPMKLRDIVNDLERIYCGTTGVEYMHIASRDKCNFIRERFEIPVESRLTDEERLQVHERLSFACGLEAFLQTKWNAMKRFGLEGCESFIPGFKSLIDRSTELGVENVTIGMPHRGRINVLSNVVRKNLSVIFREFEGTIIDADEYVKNLTETYAQSGDVKYHLGTSFTRKYPDGRSVHLSLASNPSHLEAVDPVVIGKARAKQHYDGDESGSRTMPVLIHGDAAFCGQGVVYETMHMSSLPDYSTGGCVHIVVNNQIGFTTDPANSRSTRYCTDLGKAFDCPILHVNAHDPEAVTYACKMAAEWRQTFLSDIIIDVTGYRALGHNETDEPKFTQPKMYSRITQMDNVLTAYEKRLVSEGRCDQNHLDEVNQMVHSIFEEQYQLSKTDETVEAWEASTKWRHLKMFGSHAVPKDTRVDEDVLRTIATKALTIPETFTPHTVVSRILKARLKNILQGENIDWGGAEMLAFGSLLIEGTHVRISGQDVQRGTFAHRHSVVHDQTTFEQFTGLNHLSEHQAKFDACNSSLSEFGVMGFELGYSLEDPNALIIWEAQFGDFVNGAQVMIDQFLSCGEQKWKRQCGLTLLLPHGYDGSGPEHSSSRIERFLQLSDEDPDIVPHGLGTPAARQIQDSNYQVVNATTPAQFFHVLRRQIHREFRKPLVVAAPKNLLRARECVSSMDEFAGPDARFKPLLPEVSSKVNATPDDKIRKLIFCVGKIYYELAKERETQEIDDIAIVRIEQITPFPFHLVAEQVEKYPNAELVFVQEEPKNMGCWYFCDDRIYTSTRHYLGEGRRCEYIGRRTMSSPAVGFMKVHSKEQEMIIGEALS